jgi:hypothetical protein
MFKLLSPRSVDQADCLVRLQIHSIFDMEPQSEDDKSTFEGKEFRVTSKISKIKNETSTAKAFEKDVNGNSKFNLFSKDTPLPFVNLTKRLSSLFVLI